MTMKSDPKILAQMMLQGAMPLMAQLITESEPYRMTVDAAAKGKEQIRAHFADVRKRLDEIEIALCNNYDQALARLGEILSDAGLEAIVEQAKRDMKTPPPADTEG